MNEKRFDGKANIYAKARPSYAPELIEFLKEHVLADTGSIIADIGAGTGIFTRQIARLADTVYAVEPNAADCDNIISVDGTAENTTLEENSVHCVTVAQAFHWFDPVSFRAECRRILKPNGIVVLIWNDRDENSQIIKENYALNAKYCPGFKGSSNGMDFKNITFDHFFSGGAQAMFFDNTVRYDKNAFVARNLSSSYAPKEEDVNYSAYIESLERLFERLSTDGQILYPYITRCYFGEVS